MLLALIVATSIMRFMMKAATMFAHPVVDLVAEAMECAAILRKKQRRLDWFGRMRDKKAPQLETLSREVLVMFIVQQLFV